MLADRVAVDRDHHVAAEHAGTCCRLTGRDVADRDTQAVPACLGVHRYAEKPVLDFFTALENLDHLLDVGVERDRVAASRLAARQRGQRRRQADELAVQVRAGRRRTSRG